MGSCAAPSAKGDDKFITTDYLQQCPTRPYNGSVRLRVVAAVSSLAVNTPDKTRVSPFGSQSQGR